MIILRMTSLISEEILAELVDAVERRLIVEMTKAVKSAANSMTSPDKEFTQSVR